MGYCKMRLDKNLLAHSDDVIQESAYFFIQQALEQSGAAFLCVHLKRYIYGVEAEDVCTIWALT